MRSGEVIAGRFVIEGAAGAGGMSRLFRARDRLTGDAVAVKCFEGQGAEQEERFAREARVLAELEHPGIVRYVDHGRAPGGELYLVMEWLDGEDLGRRLAREGLTLTESVALVARVAEALTVPHARGVVHRDLKPSNVYLVGGGLARVKVIDFGIARWAGAAQPLTRTGTTLGTPGYMAPEQVRGERSVDARADVFALGCMLFQCLTGAVPFAAEHHLAVLVKILFEDAPRAGAVRAGIPPALDALLARMLAKDPAERPADAVALLAELGGLDLRTELAAAPSVSPSALTEREQRLVCVVLATAGDADRPASEDTDPDGPTPDFGRGGARDTPAALGPAQDPEAPAIVAAAERFGARVEQLPGGTVAASFSSSATATELVLRAARCALALRSLVPTGSVALATGWSELSDQRPVGEVIDRAARILAAPVAVRARAPVRLDDVSARLLDGRFDVIAEGGGLELRGERDAAGPARRLLNRTTPCVGRERELANLESVLAESAGEPCARAVVVTAPGGVGKSRLAHELASRQAERAVQVFRAQGDPMSDGSPFGVLAQLVRHAMGLRAGDSLAVAQARIRARVVRHFDARERGRVAEFLGELVGAPFPDEGSVQLRAARRDARLRGDQMQRAWEDWLAAECAAQPVLLVIDDLQWGDLPSVRFLDAALRNLADRAFVVLALARPEVYERFPGLWSARALTELRLGPLPRRAAESLVRVVLGEGAPAETVGRVVDRAEGNAFYLEELVRAVAEGRGAALPESVLAMVQARVEALPAEARRVLRAASVFGQVFWEGGVRALLGGERGTAAGEWITGLVEREVLVRRGEGRFPGEAEYAFRNGLVREAAYAALTDEDRARGHRAAGEWLEGVGEPEALVLAEHCERGGARERAAHWYLRAAARCLGGSDLSAVLRACERALACGASGEALGSLRLLQAEAHGWRGASAEARACGREAMRLLPRGSEAWCAAVKEVALASGRMADEVELRALARELLPGDGVVVGGSLGIVALCCVALQLLLAGRGELSRDLMAWLDAVHRGVAGEEPAVAAWIHRVRAARVLADGDPGAYLRSIEATAECHAQAGNVRNACTQRTNTGYAYLELGAYGQAEAVLRDALAAAERLEMGNIAAVALQNLGMALAWQGRLEEARAAVSAALEAFVAQADRRSEGYTRAYLATVRALQGALDDAEAEARRAAGLGEALSPVRACALGTLARVLLARERGAEALECAAEAMAVLEALGGIEEGEALVRGVYAEALAAVGRWDDARAAIAVARARIEERAARIRDEALRAGFLEAHVENARTLGIARSWLGG